MRRFAAVLLALALAAAGCASAPIEGERLDRLRADVRAASPPPVVLRAVGPREIAAGEARALVRMPAIVAGRQVARFDLYDLYFKTIFAAVDDLRALGFEAHADPALWGARLDALRFEARAVSSEVLNISLARIGAQADVPDPYRLSFDQRVNLYASRSTLLAARNAVPLARRGKSPPTAREIRDAWFLADGAPVPPLALELDILDHEVAAEEGVLGDERRGRAAVKVAFRMGGRLLYEAEIEVSATSPGSGLGHDPMGGYTFALAEDEPLERAIRLALREAVRDALPAITAAARRS